MGGGVARAGETWAYAFYPDGSYKTYLNGYQQYSGTWSQEGSFLTINTPAIPGSGMGATSFTMPVTVDGNSFTTNGNTYIRIN
jgi:hypothetical protein